MAEAEKHNTLLRTKFTKKPASTLTFLLVDQFPLFIGKYIKFEKLTF